MLRNWNILHSRPSDYTRQHGELEGIRTRLRAEWESISNGAEWDERSARSILDFVLPDTANWLDGENAYIGDARRQGIQYERYWQRAVNEAIDSNEVRDQKVARDLGSWCNQPSFRSDLVSGICTSERYSDVWEDLAYAYLRDDSARTLLLCEYVLRHICEHQRATASDDSQGFVSTWRYANRRVERNDASREWLENRIEEAVTVSLRLVNSLWHYFGTGRYSIVRPEDIPGVRQRQIQILQQHVTSGEVLGRILDPKYPYVLYQLIFDPGEDNPSGHADISAWRWLSPILLDALRSDNTLVAVNVASMIAARESHSRTEPLDVNPNLLFTFFGRNAREVIDRLEQLATSIVEQEQRHLVAAISASGRIALQDNNPSGQ